MQCNLCYNIVPKGVCSRGEERHESHKRRVEEAGFGVLGEGPIKNTYLPHGLWHQLREANGDQNFYYQ